MQAGSPELLNDLAWVVEAELAFHDSDAKAAIAALIEDRRQLHDQLELADAAISRGYTRGWRPGHGR